ncbi:MAG: pyruvate kinase [Chloroflexi bacterium RBG_16_57_11]|nr:MAG: pyruvate kinase [Chloroflexi bacterium RBG_16_57_11]
MDRRARIVATIGPASQDEAVLQGLIEAGMDVARLNFSHGSYENHTLVYNRIRHISSRLGRPVTILQDLQGPKIRTGEIENGQVEINAGQRLTLTTLKVVGNAELVSVDFPGLPKSVQPGGRILLDDGALELTVVEVSGDRVETRVVIGGTLKPHKGVNLPWARLKIPALTHKDAADLEFGLNLGMDALAVSFVRSAENIEVVRKKIEKLAPQRSAIPIIAKLERPEALANLEAIIEAADGVMVARGDLGVEMSPETVPIAQKRIIESANQRTRIVITATQMLESMINNPRPTRAEASDVANAIFDGTDAVMLSGETAAGKYPLQAVKMMHEIVCQAENHLAEWGRWGGMPEPGHCDDDTYFTSRAARDLARDRNVAALAVFTDSGRASRLLSKQRPQVPILAFTPEIETYRRLNLHWGVTPHFVPRVETIEEMLRVVEEAMLAKGSIQAGQQVVLICGYPIRENRPTNLAMLHTVGER